MQHPNFLIIGAAKAGTTSLYYYLEQHPDIFMAPVKEPRFFAPEFYTTNSNGFIRNPGNSQPWTLADYQALFQNVRDEKAVGEASTEYLYFSETPRRIKEYNSSMKLIAVLRNPVERAYSAYCYQSRDGCEVLSFEEALAKESARKAEGWRPGWLYKESSLYHSQLLNYFSTFSANQIRVYLAEDLQQNTEEVVRSILQFLEVDSTLKFDKSQKNVSYLPRNRYLNRFLKQNTFMKNFDEYFVPKPLHRAVKSLLTKAYSPSENINEATRESLIHYFRDDILALEKLIDRDLSHWLTI